MTDTNRLRLLVPALARRSDDRVLTGTSAGLADLCGVDALVIRVAFVTLGIAGGFGIALYLAAYLYSLATDPVPGNQQDVEPDRAGERLFGVGLVSFGLMFAARAFWPLFVDSVAWPLAVLAVGFVIAVEQGQLQLKDLGLSPDSGRPSARLMAARVLIGLGLTVGGFVALLAFNFDIGEINELVLAALAIIAGIALVLGPWIGSVTGDLVQEKRRRIRSEERAELAAQLHDSVLQTLSLIQRSDDDPARMVQLARRQERELRSWLHGDGRLGHSERLREGLETAAAEVEDDHGTPIDVVVVGDATADERVRSLLLAAREAMLNAARHSKAARIDVFAEVAAGSVEIYVRDTGVGFDPDAIETDRRGVTESIMGRMKRLGGSAVIQSNPGEGTEVELEMPLSSQESTRVEEGGTR